MAFKILLIAAVFGLTIAAPQGYQAPKPSYDSPEESDAKYDFDWRVSDEYSNNHYGQQESRDGDNTQGSYDVLLPDGRRQIVTYYVDGDNGFVADVKYEGSVEESSYERPQPKYEAPKPKSRYD